MPKTTTTMTPTQTALTPLISEFRALAAKDSVSPETVGYLLQRIVDSVPDTGALTELATAASSSAISAQEAARDAAASASAAASDASEAKTIARGAKTIAANASTIATAAKTTADAAATTANAAQDAVETLEATKGKAGGLAPLGDDRRVPDRYLPDFHCVCRFDRFIDDTSGTITVSDTPLATTGGEAVQTAWIRKPDGSGCFAEALAAAAAEANAEAASIPDSQSSITNSQSSGVVAQGKWHRLQSAVMADGDGLPWPEKIYICTSPLKLYAADASGYLAPITL